MISRIRQTFVFHADKVINILYNHCVIEGEHAHTWNLKPTEAPLTQGQENDEDNSH